MSEVSDSSPTLRQKTFGILFAVLSLAFLIAGFVTATTRSLENGSLANEIRDLKEELGLIHVADTQRAYFVAIDDPNVPSFLTESVDRIWQFHYYLPTGYRMDYFSGPSRLTEEGFCYERILKDSAWSTRRPESNYKSISNWFPRSISSRIRNLATSKRLNISATKKKDYIEIYCSLGSIIRWQPPDPDFSIEDLVIEPIVLPGDPARSFGPKEFIPVFKIYDPASAKELIFDGQIQTTYSGALLCIYSGRESHRNRSLLLSGKQIKLAKGSVGSERE